jgi:hypothetical protein
LAGTDPTKERELLRTEKSTLRTSASSSFSPAGAKRPNCLAVSMQLKNHEWTLMNTNLLIQTMIQPFAPQSLNDDREFYRKGTPIVWFHWCLFVFIGGSTESLRLRGWLLNVGIA